MNTLKYANKYTPTSAWKSWCVCVLVFYTIESKSIHTITYIDSEKNTQTQFEFNSVKLRLKLAVCQILLILRC